jgi:hypothetical protein
MLCQLRHKQPKEIRSGPISDEFADTKRGYDYQCQGQEEIPQRDPE